MASSTTAPTTAEILPASAAGRIASYLPRPVGLPDVETAQAAHRIRLVNAWAATGPGRRVLELGCGQGSCTAVLAEAVGPSGLVDAVDPAPGSYGSPFTLAQAQAHLSTSGVGARIAWHRADPVAFLASSAGSWDAAVLAHCIWYFDDRAALAATLAALRGRVAAVCVAEYALAASQPAAVPHLVAALARAARECLTAHSTENIRTPLGPAGIREVAAAAGWRLDAETVLVPDAELQDGRWETGAVAAETFLELPAGHESDRVAVLLQSAREATISAAAAVGGVKMVRTMNVWVAKFVA